KNKVKSGKYLIYNGVNNWDLVNLLRSGEQKPVRVVLNNIRLKEDLCREVGKQIEADSTVLLSMLNDKYYLRKYSLTTESVMSIFIPNSYEFYWTTSPEQFFERMTKEYKKFWTTQRKKKAELIGFTPLEVSVMASIVQKETAKNDEKARIAGVYMNRYKKDWKLQADPTVIFAVQDFTIRRILKQHLKFDSPYNTYIYTGLPPGPICAPSISSIDAVLNYEDHNYMYFCAKEDFSGYHNFAKTYSQHKVNARKYRKAFKNRNKS
ncbi:MAG: endolytic transglycosylase MltG, partial [Bacteroidia bacterium]|nr:endolytic transglycosylase MltG [Bacteroidia bacterium]